MSATRLFDLIDSAVAALRLTDGLCEPGDLAGGVPVFDGPALTQSDPDDYVIVGARGLGDEDVDNASTVDAEWMSVPIQAGSRTESLTIPCAVVAWGGTSSFSTLRTRMQATLDLVAGTLLDRATYDDVDGVSYICLTDFTVEQVAEDDGNVVRATFTLAARTLL